MAGSLIYQNTPTMSGATLLLALTGWMDGGLVSTGTVRQFMRDRDLTAVAKIDPAGFYVDNMPGDMETAAMFRPHVKYKKGIVVDFDWPTNELLADPRSNIAFFVGKEPNINWISFANCLFEAAEKLNVTRIIFVGSFGGSVPHTREPRLFGSASEKKLLPILKQHGIRLSQYEGPASFATYLLTRAPKHKMEMLSIAAEIPSYLQGANPLSIEALTRRLAHIINQHVDLAKLRETSTKWELGVTEAIEKDAELAEQVKKLEEEYDSELVEQSE